MVPGSSQTRLSILYIRFANSVSVKFFNFYQVLIVFKEDIEGKNNTIKTNQINNLILVQQHGAYFRTYNKYCMFHIKIYFSMFFRESQSYHFLATVIKLYTVCTGNCISILYLNAK